MKQTIEPQEEPKQEYYCKACGISQDEPFSKCHESHKHCSCEIRLTEESKQERMYSEEDLREAFIAGGNSQIEEDDGYGSRYLKYMEEWFKQFKKK